MSASTAAGGPVRGRSAPLPAIGQRVSRRDWIAVMGGILGSFMAILDIQITNASLKDIQGSLAAGVEEGSWISTAYLIAEIIVIPLTAWLAQVFSLKRYLMVNGALFLVFSVLCGLSTSLPEMIVFRAFQGFTGGVLIPLAFTILLVRLPPSQRPIGSALFGVTATFAPAIGPTVGGWLTDTLSWRWIFYINLVPGLVQLAMVGYGLDAGRMQLDRLRRGDWTGIALMAVGLGCLEYVLEEGQRKDWFGSESIRVCAIVAGVSLLAFLVVELVKREPLLDLKLLRNRGLASACTVNLAAGLGLYGSVYVLPLYLAQVQGYDALRIGELQMWLGLPQLVILPVVPFLMRYIDSRAMVAFGMVLFAASCLMNSTMSHDTGYDQLRLSQLVRALGQPFIMAPLANMATIGIAPAQAGAASGLFNMMRNLGGSMGIAILSTLLATREQFHFSVIAERLSANALRVHERLGAYAARLGAAGGDAPMQALALLRNLVRREAMVMAYGDAFFIIAVSLLIGMTATVLLVRARPGASGGGGH